MGSSSQNSSGVHWCTRRVKFNEVPEKVPEVPEKVWDALVQSQVKFNRAPEKVPEKVPDKVPGEPGEVQQGSREGSGEGLGGFGAGPGQVPTGSNRFQQVQQGFQGLALQHASERFAKIKRCGCWGYHRFFFYKQGEVWTSTSPCYFDLKRRVGELTAFCFALIVYAHYIPITVPKNIWQNYNDLTANSLE